MTWRYEPLFVSEQGNPVTAKSIEARWIEFRASIKKTLPFLPTAFTTYARPTVHIA